MWKEIFEVVGTLEGFEGMAEKKPVFEIPEDLTPEQIEALKAKLGEIEKKKESQLFDDLLNHPNFNQFKNHILKESVNPIISKLKKVTGELEELISGTSTLKVMGKSKDGEFLQGRISKAFFSYLNEKDPKNDENLNEILEGWKTHPDNKKPGLTYSLKSIKNHVNY